jgi:glycolate oxidase FAD binding subunit
LSLASGTAAEVVAPRSVEEAVDVVRAAARAGHVVLPRGCGSKSSWTRAPRRVDVELSTRELAGIVAYEPGDGTITALAGTRWGDLSRVAAEHGHHLSPEIPDADHATVGGVIAAGQSGLDRLRYGPVRHHVLGMRVLLADGTVARTGGRLVKNVTGFDVHRLHTGAHGTLGLVVEVSLRLHALPEARAFATAITATRAEALNAARAALSAPREPWAVLVHDLGRDGDARFFVTALLAGRAEALEQESRAASSTFAGSPLVVGSPGTPDATRVADLWAAHARMERAGGSWPTLRATCRASELERVWGALADACATAGVQQRALAHPGTATLDAFLRPPFDAHAVRSIDRALRAAGARAHWRGLGDDAPRGDEPAGIAVMRSLKRVLDPHGLWAGGRMPGGL